MQRLNSTAFGMGLYDVGKIFYGPEQRKIHIKRMFIFLLNEVIKDKKIENIVELIRENGHVYAASVCSRLVKFSKNNSFVDEDEVRLYHNSTSIKGTFHLIELMGSDIEEELCKNMKKNLKKLIEQ